MVKPFLSEMRVLSIFGTTKVKLLDEMMLIYVSFYMSSTKKLPFIAILT